MRMLHITGAAVLTFAISAVAVSTASLATSLATSPAHATRLKSNVKPKGGDWYCIIWEKVGNTWVCRLQEKTL